MFNLRISDIKSASPLDEQRRSSPELYQSAREFFKKKINICDRSFEKVWENALAAHQITWTKGTPLTDKTLQETDRALRETLVYSGKGIQIEAKSSGNDPVHDAISRLLGGATPFLRTISQANAQAVFLQKDPEILRAMRQEFRNVLQACSAKLPAPGSKEEILFQTFIGNIGAFLPYSYPPIGESFPIPQKINGRWKVCEYTVDRRIEMSPDWLLSPMVAYGLVSKEGPPILTFLGTTYPAGDGFAATLFSDFTPGMSVGHAAYLYGKSQIEEWMKMRPGQVRLYGASLGGALCFHVLRNHRDRVGQVDVYNPAGLYPWNWGESFNGPAPINLYCQENDLVSTMGMFPTGKSVSIYRVFGPKVENFLWAHAVAFSGGEQVLIAKSSPEYENGRLIRKVLTGLHAVVSVLIGLVPAISLGILYLIYSVWKRVFPGRSLVERIPATLKEIHRVRL